VSPPGAACQSSGKGLTLVNPLASNTPFPNNQIPVSMMNPVAAKIASNYLPLASADQCGKVGVFIPITGDEDQWIGKIDYAQSPKNAIYGRYFIVDFQNPPTYNGSNLLTTTQAGNLERAQSATIGDNYTFGPGTLNTFHVTFNRRRDNRGPTDIRSTRRWWESICTARCRTSCC